MKHHLFHPYLFFLASSCCWIRLDARARSCPCDVTP
jgi:hypothetical protein